MYKTIPTFSFIALLASLTLACGPVQSDSGGEDDGGDVPDAREAPNFDAWTPPPDASGSCSKMDILFVIDDSGSMAQEQANLAQNFPLFIQVLEDRNLDYRVGVTTTGRTYTYTDFLGFPNTQEGDDGELLQRCDMTQRWVSPTDPNPAQTFACAAEVGTNGPIDEMPLAVTKAAFTEQIANGTNAGFLRDDALLALVILTDENDCSYEQSVSLGLLDFLCESDMEPVQTYVDTLDTVKEERGRWATAVIAGPTNCSSEFGDAAEATRLQEFVDITGDNAVFSSICEGDLTIGLEAALDTFEQACNSFPPIE